MCKVNNASTVKVILPVWQLEELNKSRVIGNVCDVYVFVSSYALSRKEVDVLTLRILCI
jgi:hypothetical protein